MFNQKGELVEPTQFKGKPIILTFVFAHCMTVCPALLKQTLATLEKIPQDQVTALFITLDPWRDTPLSLPGIAEKWDFPSNAHFLSNAVPLVTHTLDQFGVPYQRDEKTGDISHPALVHVIDSSGSVAYTFNNPSIEWLTEAVKRASTP